jgi:hypothetical protein
MASLKSGTFWLHCYDQRYPPYKKVITNLILILNKNLLSGIRIQRELERREQIRILERKPQFALIIAGAFLESLQNVLRNSLQFLSREPDTVILLIQVLLELDLDLSSSASSLNPRTIQHT